MTPSSRQVAVEVVWQGERGAQVDWLLDECLARAGHPKWAPRATALTYGTLRLIARLDYVLQPLLDRPLGDLEPLLRAILRVGCYELLFTAETTPAAAVHSLVDLAQDREWGGHVGIGRLTNAVLRRVAGAAEEMRRPPSGWPAFQMLTQWWSLPPWISERWLSRWGDQRALEQAAAAATEPSVCLRVNRTRATRDQVIERLVAAEIEAQPSDLHPAGVRLTGGAPARLPGWADGWFTVQDEASLAIADLVGAEPGLRVIDLCAAPGGKATQLAETGCELVAVDIDRGRLDRLRDTADRLGLRFETVCGDARTMPGRLEPADAVLLDAPCTGSGTLARRPDLRWRLGPERLATAVKIQRSILLAAVKLLRPGGRLIYSTCSLEAEENEDQMAWLAREHPEILPTAEPDTTTFPVAGRHDGFFSAVRRRRD